MFGLFKKRDQWVGTDRDPTLLSEYRASIASFIERQERPPFAHLRDPFYVGLLLGAVSNKLKGLE